MKILVLNYEFPPIGGGASPVSYDLAKELVKCGHDVTVVTMKYKGLDSYELKDGIEIYRVKCIRKSSNVCHPWEQMSYLISAYVFIQKKLEKKNYDVIHTHFIIPTGVLAYVLKKRLGIPYIITAHGSDVIGHNNKRFKYLYKMLVRPWSAIVREAETVVAPSRYLKLLMEKTEPNANYKIIPNGIDTSCFYVKEKKPIFLVLARLQETKGIQDILKAVSLVDMKQWKLVILGDGPYRENLERLSIDLQIERYVEFKGWVENKSKNHLEYLAKSSVFMSASHVENCPTSILEALCSGCEVLVSDIPAHKQMLGDESVSFQDGNIDEIAMKMQNVIDRVSDKRVSSINIEDYDFNKVIPEYEKLLLGVVK